MPTLKLYATLRTLAGVAELQVTGSTVRSVLIDAIRKAPALRAALMANEELGSNVVLILNGLNVIDLDAPILDGDTLAMFPPIAGGSAMLAAPGAML